MPARCNKMTFRQVSSVASENLILRIEGIQSEREKAEVKRFLEAVEGVTWTCIDGEAGMVVVLYDPEQTSQDTLLGALVEAGYEVKRFFTV